MRFFQYIFTFIVFLKASSNIYGDDDEYSDYSELSNDYILYKYTSREIANINNDVNHILGYLMKYLQFLKYLDYVDPPIDFFRLIFSNSYQNISKNDFNNTEAYNLYICLKPLIIMNYKIYKNFDLNTNDLRSIWNNPDIFLDRIHDYLEYNCNLIGILMWIINAGILNSNAQTFYSLQMNAQDTLLKNSYMIFNGKEYTLYTSENICYVSTLDSKYYKFTTNFILDFKHALTLLHTTDKQEIYKYVSLLNYNFMHKFLEECNSSETNIISQNPENFKVIQINNFRGKRKHKPLRKPFLKNSTNRNANYNKIQHNALNSLFTTIEDNFDTTDSENNSNTTNLNKTYEPNNTRGRPNATKQDNSLEINSKPDNSLEINSKPDNSLEINSKQDNSLEINSKPDNSLKVNSKPDNSLEINSKPDEPLEINSKPDNSLEINSKPDEPLEINSKQELLKTQHNQIPRPSINRSISSKPSMGYIHINPSSKRNVPNVNSSKSKIIFITSLIAGLIIFITMSVLAVFYVYRYLTKVNRRLR